MKTMAPSLLGLLVVVFAIVAWAACGGGNEGKGAVSPELMQQSDGGGPLPDVPPVPSK